MHILLLLALLPGWMSGTWRSSEGERVTEEIWSGAEGTVMTGTHRLIRPDRKTWFEFLRIEQRGESLVYVAMPGGGPATEFVATDVGESSITFENPQHDFPRRIRYWRDGAALCARVEGPEESGKAQQWCWDPVP